MERTWRDDVKVPVRTVAHFLDELHYLGAAKRGIAWSDEFGVVVLAKPTSRRLPQDGTWLELTRWCLLGERNGGSRQWKCIVRWLKAEMPHVTTIVSYSDPSVGHTGALYKACNWRWAPTWHRLRTPPTGNGSWANGEVQAAKDRWIYPLRCDPRRVELLAVQDESLVRRGCPQYSEPGAAATELVFVSTQNWTPDPPAAADTALEQRAHAGSLLNATVGA